MMNLLTETKNCRNNKTLFDIRDILFCILLITLCSLNFIQDVNIVVNILILVFIVSIFVSYSAKKIVISSFSKNFLLFVLAGFVSLLINGSTDLSINRIITLSECMIFLISCDNYFRVNSHKLVFFSTTYILAGLFSSIFILLSEGLNSGERIGTSIGDVNTIGIFLSYICCFLFFFICKSKRKLFKFFAIAGLCLITFIIILTGSRSALLTLIFESIVFIFLIGNIKKRMIKYFIICTILILFLFISIYNIPFFYDSIGIRIDSFFSIISGTKSSIQEGSTQERISLVNLGFQLFIENPFLGIGPNNTGLYTSQIVGRSTFLHNNYIELLSTFGLIGFVLYYMIYINIILKALRLYKKTKSFISVLALSVMAGFLISDLFLVKYYQKFELVTLCLLNCIVSQSE